MPVTGAILNEALRAVGAGNRLVRPLDELAAGLDSALRAAPPGLTGIGAASYAADKAQESDYFRATEEYAKNGRYKPYIGRTFQMITWDTNYLKFGQWAKKKGLIQNSERQFVDDPKWLADYRWAWLGGVWYFEANGLWRYANAGDHLSVSQIVNGGLGMKRDGRKPNHWDVRKRMFDVFARYGDRLLPTGIAPARPPQAPVLPRVPTPESFRFNEGDTGDRVVHWQNWFNVNFPLYSNIDLGPKRYGPQTVKVVKEFATRCGIQADGKNIGPQISRAMFDNGYVPA